VQVLRPVQVRDGCRSAALLPAATQPTPGAHAPLPVPALSITVEIDFRPRLPRSWFSAAGYADVEGEGCSGPRKAEGRARDGRDGGGRVNASPLEPADVSECAGQEGSPERRREREEEREREVAAQQWSERVGSARTFCFETEVAAMQV
jgi:hypothetical protein